MNMEKPKDAANDNEHSRTGRLQSIRASIEAQGGVKAPSLDRAHKSLKNALNWMASHRELLKEDFSMALDKIGTIISRVPEVLYEKYREHKRKGRESVFAKSVDAVVETYFGAKKLTRWGSAFAMRRSQELKSLYEQGNNIYTSVIDGFRRGAELSKTHRAQREGITEDMIEAYQKDLNSKAAFMGTASVEQDQYLVDFSEQRANAKRNVIAANEAIAFFSGRAGKGNAEHAGLGAKAA